eukprot:scaffold22701_cov123-Cylindrotheca_fusiformis.AAC.23
MHQGLEHIQERAFGGCESLTELRIPSTVKSIDRGAFNMPSLTYVGIDGFDNLALAIQLHVLFPDQIGLTYLARLYCRNPIDPSELLATQQNEREILQQVKHEVDLLTESGHLALILGEELSDAAVWIYNGKDEIPMTLWRVKIGENVVKIPDEAFKSRQALEEVVISPSVKEIGNSAFEGCKLLNSVHLQLGQFHTVGCYR